MRTTLTSLADGADVLPTGLSFQRPLPTSRSITTFRLATLYYFPMRADGQLVRILLSPLVRSAMTVYEWLSWRMAKKFRDAQRREQAPRRNGSQDADRWKFRPTTRFASPGWQRDGEAGGPLLAG